MQNSPSETFHESLRLKPTGRQHRSQTSVNGDIKIKLNGNPINHLLSFCLLCVTAHQTYDGEAKLDT